MSKKPKCDHCKLEPIWVCVNCEMLLCWKHAPFGQHPACFDICKSYKKMTELCMEAEYEV